MDKRADHVEKLSARMVAWDNEIDRLKDKARSAPSGPEPDYSRAIAELASKRDAAAQKLQGISAASDDEWEELKAGTDRAWGEVAAILRDAVVKIK